MLKLIPPLFGLDLLAILRAMGHGDEIAIVEANYPADSARPALVRLDDISATDILDAVMTLMPPTISSTRPLSSCRSLAIPANASGAMIQNGERWLYGNIILKKGIIRPDA
ncbi:MAG: hypothetical protein MO846_11430 [Candidatus Devosia symbiotica]|nr:hypothetical protein [Candidatus Devosia symbiotica]